MGVTQHVQARIDDRRKLDYQSAFVNCHQVAEILVMPRTTYIKLRVLKADAH